jgi:hypothetical protein
MGAGRKVPRGSPRLPQVPVKLRAQRRGQGLVRSDPVLAGVVDEPESPRSARRKLRRDEGDATVLS